MMRHCRFAEVRRPCAAEALREAQLAMIRDGKAPLYWAPFILIGE